MPTFSAISLDRLLDTGAPTYVPPTTDSKLKRTKSISTPPTTATRAVKEEKKRSQLQWVSPALYATPEAIPAPDAPSSYPPSPYVINHKRRGPRLLKSNLSVDSASLQPKAAEDEEAVKKVEERNEDVVDTSNEMGSNGMDETKVLGDGEFSFGAAPVVCNSSEDMVRKGVDDGLSEINNSSSNLVSTSVGTEFEFEDFFDPQESLSVASNSEVEDGGLAGRSCRQSTPMGDYFDACEELSTEGTTQSSMCDVESELRGVRFNLLMEIERRKQAEEALEKIQCQWQRLRQQLSLVGLTLPESMTTTEEDGDLNINPSEELCQQVHLARVVSICVGRASAKAEFEMEMESQIEAKHFEIARLLDRLRYYEAANDEMFQRKQEAIGSNHLLEAGLEGFYGQSCPERNQFNPGFQDGTYFISNNQISGIDFATVHSYPDQWVPSSNDQEQLSFLTNWLDIHIQDAQNVLRKPLLLAEFRKSWKDPGYNTSMRGLHVQNSLLQNLFIG